MDTVSTHAHHNIPVAPPGKVVILENFFIFFLQFTEHDQSIEEISVYSGSKRDIFFFCALTKVRG